MIHLEGMGVLGCYIAHRLQQDSIEFTWSDTRTSVTAWRACTGAIFPTGHAEDMQAMVQWGCHYHEPAFRAHMEVADYVFSTKNPPHGGRYTAIPLVGDVKLGTVASLHLNAQTFVPSSRRLFALYEEGGPGPGDTTVVTHGFGERLARYMWGWTVPVSLKTTMDSERRPSVYFRRGRFVMAYAYPAPRTPLWYAGSSLISQREPRSLDVPSKFERWRQQFLELGAGYVTHVEAVGQPIEGWRPVPAENDTAWVRQLKDGRWAVKPLWHSGVRHAPLVYDALKEAAL